jgi:hypothetical protein
VALSSPELGLQPLRCARVPAKGQERERGVRGSVLGLTEGRAVAGQPGDSGEGGGGENSGAGSLGARNWGKEEHGRSGERRGCRGALL